MPGAFETLYVRVRGDSDLQKTFAKDEKAAGKLDKTLGGIFKKYSDKKIGITVEEDGAAKTAAALKGVDKVADSVDGRSVDIDVDKDGSALKGVEGLSSGFKGLAGNIRATGTVLSAASIPFAIAGIGAGTPTILALGSSFAGLAVNLGKAAAGFGLVAGAAYGGALVGLKAYTAILSSTVSASREAYAATHENAMKQLELQRTTILNTQASKDFNNQLNETIIGLTHVQAEIGNRVFPLFTKELQAWSDQMDVIGPKVVDTAFQVSRVAAGFSEWFRTAGDGKVFADTLDFINLSAIKASATLAAAGQAGIMAFQPLIPLATDLQTKVLGLSYATDAWVESAEGQRRLSQIYTSLWEDAKRLGPVLMDTGRGLFNIFSAIDRSGLSDQATRGLESIASSFEHVTREGTESRRKIDAFLNSSLELMPHVAGAATALWKQIFRVADAAIDAREEGHKLTILQEIFDGIRDSARPLGNLLIGTFSTLGPEIAKLIPNLARLAETFAGSSGPLVTFVRTLNRAMSIFNSLPTPVKNTVANLLALKLIMGAMGAGVIPGLAASLFQLLINQRLLAGQTKILAAQQTAAAASTSRFAAAARGLRAVMATLVLPVGAVAAVGAAFVVAYKHSKTFRRGVDALDMALIGNKNTSELVKNGWKGLANIARDNAGISKLWSGNLRDLEGVWKHLDIKYEGSALQQLFQKLRNDSDKTKKGATKDAWDMKRQSIAAWTAEHADAIPVFGKLAALIAGKTAEAKTKGTQNAWSLKQQSERAYVAQHVDAIPVFGKLLKLIVDRTSEAESKGTKNAWDLKRGTDSAWHGILDATPIWGDIAAKVIDPTKSMVSQVKAAWSDLLNFLADVVSRLGFKDLAASIRGAVPAGKGSSYGGSGGDNPNTKTVENFARGGIHNADRGGVAGPGRMGLVGEAGQKEAIVNLEKRTPESQMAFREAARSPNARGGRHAPDRGHIPMGTGYRMFASGGVWYPKTSGVNAAVENRWPVQGSTYAGHGADGDAKNSVDWMTGQGWGVAATGQFLERGNQIVDYLLKQQKSFTDYIIWQRKMYDSGGVSTYRGGGGYPAPTTVSGWHEDHVHWESLENNPGPSVMGGGVSGGVTVPTKEQLLYNALWPRVANMAKGFFSPLTSSPKILSQVAGKISQNAIDKFGTWLDNKIPDTTTIGGGTGSYTGGGSLDKWLAAGLKLGGAFPANASNVAKLHSLAMEESSGNPNAVNNLPGNDDPSGLLQVKPSTFRQYMVPGHGSILDPEDNTAASTRYQKARYGTLQSHAPYARGGIATGPGIVGEAGDDEAVINLNRRTRESQMAFRAAAKSPNALHRFATGGLSFNGPLASQAIGIARSFWGPSGASFGFGPGWTVRVRQGMGAARTGNGIIGVDPQWVGSSLFDEILGHEIGHAGGLSHAGPPEALMTNPVMRGDRPIASELSAFARNVGATGGSGGGASGGTGGSGAGGAFGGSVSRNSIYKSGGGSQSASTYSGSSAARGRALIEGAVAGWGRPFSGHSPARDIERGAKAGEAQVDELKGLRRDINRLMKVIPHEFGSALRGKGGQDLHREHQERLREKFAAAGRHVAI